MENDIFDGEGGKVDKKKKWKFYGGQIDNFGLESHFLTSSNFAFQQMINHLHLHYCCCIFLPCIVYNKNRKMGIWAETFTYDTNSVMDGGIVLGVMHNMTFP